MSDIAGGSLPPLSDPFTGKGFDDHTILILVYSDLQQVKEQTRKTNGRVTFIEKAIYVLFGLVASIGISNTGDVLPEIVRSLQ